MAELVFENVTKRFGNIVAVSDLSLRVADGEFLVLLGPTGAGKTTTLRLAAGLEVPEAGAIRIAGADVTRAAPPERDVAFVFQQYSLYPHYSVFDNMAFPLRSPRRRSDEARIEAKVKEVARLLRIESKLGNRATQLSGGEMQRVAIGRALVRSPAAFLMDEPLSSLDAKLREDLRVELKRIQVDLGATVLYVTHDQLEAMTLADRIGVLSEGRLVQVGTPREVYAQPNSAYVARRLGSPRINLLPPGALGVSDGPPDAATLGVRPEDIVLGRGGVGARVRAVEHLGAETVVLLETGGQEVHALAAPGESYRPGQDVTVSTPSGAALFFDADGRRIPAQRRPAARADVEKAYGS
ncbi:MAG: ABC transporter ATP-binding protein [Kiloniellaceae bacterium]